ncbi:MAG: FxLYD domain-containing protein [Candidatus Binatia bacterium]|nr:FxLYD domain-containing protein [Candidatus Binatia bacterium]
MAFSLPPAQPARPLREETLPARAVPQVVITGITNSESADRQILFVEGRLRNEGTAATQQLRVQVNALDGSGQVLTSTTALPVPQIIPPGGSATFLVRFPNDPAIRRFHVEAEIR